jgi:hypothetical protein
MSETQAKQQRAAITRASLLTDTTITLGAAYFGILVVVPFPSDWLRLVPAVWLAGAVAGLTYTIPAFRASALVRLAVFLVVVNLVSSGLAVLFLFGALMGD